MRKKSAILFGFLLATLISMSMTSVVQAYISDYRWIGACYYGYDYFLDDSVVAYETDEDATLIVSVYSSWYVGYPIYDYVPVNVSAVKVGFDWGVNYTSTECSEASPVQIEPFESRVFTVTFTVPATTTASNLVVHWYTIYVEHVNSTTGPKKIVGTWTEYDDDFAVYSADQTDAQELAQKLDEYDYPAPAAGVINYYRSDCFEARVLWEEGTREEAAGYDSYNSGNFTDAKTHYENAKTKYDEALSVLSSRGKELENVDITSANAAMNESLAWIIFGIGMVLIGVGVIIYAVKKPKAAEAA